MFGRLNRVLLSTMLSVSTFTSVGLAIPLVAHAAGQSCPVRYWSGPYVSEDDRTHRTYVQALVVLNCPIYGRGGDVVQFQVRRGATVVASGSNTCGAGCDIHNIPVVAVSPTCTSTASTTYTPRYRVLVDDKFGWSDWVSGPPKSIPCRV